MKINRILILLFLLSLNFISFSQIIFKDKINWQQPKQFTLKNGIYKKKFYKLQFDNSLIFNNYELPIYFKKLPVATYGDVVAKLSPIKTEIINNKQIYGLTSVPEKYTYEAKIYSQRGKYYLIFKLLPLRRLSDGRLERIDEFEVSFQIKAKKLHKAKFVSHSVLAHGKWYKIAIPEDGVYKITFDQWSPAKCGRGQYFAKHFSVLSLLQTKQQQFLFVRSLR